MLSPLQIKKVKKATKLIKEGATSKDLFLSNMIVDLEYKVDTLLPHVEIKLRKTLIELQQEVKKNIFNLSSVLEQIKSNLGQTPTTEELINLIKTLIPQPIKGDKGDTVINEKIIEIVKEQPIITQQIKEVAVFDEKKIEEVFLKLLSYGTAVRDGLENLPEKEKLTIDAIYKLREELDKHAKQVNQSVIALRTLMTIQSAGTSLAQRSKLNFVGATVTDDSANDAIKVTIAAGSSWQTPTGTVNGVNKVFTVTVAPVIVVTEQGTMIENFGYTRSGLTITLDLAPQSFIRSSS